MAHKPSDFTLAGFSAMIDLLSPRIIHLPLSGRDRRHYVRELRAAEQTHRDLPAKVEEAYRAAHRLACQEWSVRQFIGGRAAR